MAKKFDALDVRKILFEEDDAGEISVENDSDDLELQDYSENEFNDIMHGLDINSNQMNTEYDSEKLNLDEKILEFENKFTYIGSSVDSLMSVTQSLTFSSSLMSISSDKLFKKPANLPQSITMQSFKFLTRENSITDPKKEETN